MELPGFQVEATCDAESFQFTDSFTMPGYTVLGSINVERVDDTVVGSSVVESMCREGLSTLNLSGRITDETLSLRIERSECTWDNAVAELLIMHPQEYHCEGESVGSNGMLYHAECYTSLSYYCELRRPFATCEFGSTFENIPLSIEECFF